MSHVWKAHLNGSAVKMNEYNFHVNIQLVITIGWYFFFLLISDILLVYVNWWLVIQKSLQSIKP